MIVELGESFNLPRLGKETFIRLVRNAGLKYDKSKGFTVDSGTNIQLVISILERELSEKIEIGVRCFICSKPAGCDTCSLNNACDRTRVSPACICMECMRAPEAFAHYSVAFSEKL